VLAAVWAASGNGLSLTVLAALGLLTRDVAIFLLMRGRAGGRGDFAALAILGALYLLLPMILNGLNLPGLGLLFLPEAKVLSVVAAWAQAAGTVVLALRGVGLLSPSR